MSRSSELTNPSLAPLPVLAIDEDRCAPAAFMAIAAIGLSTAIQIRDGLIQPQAVMLLGVAIAACLAAFLLPELGKFESRGDRPLVLVMCIGLLMQFGQLLTAPLPGSWHGVEINWRFQVGQTCAAILAVALILFPRHAHQLFLLLIGTFLLLGIWIIHYVPEPFMDVWMVQTQSLRVFHLHGNNPYTAVYRDPYGRARLYAPGAIIDGKVHQGFPYPPVVFWMALIGYGLFQDYRYASLLSMAGTALLIGYSRPTRVAKLAAVLFLFTPRAFFVLESGWTEPFSALLLAAVVFYACRAMSPSHAIIEDPTNLASRGRLAMWMSAATGLFVASKQYLVFAAPVAILLLGRRFSWRSAIKPAAVAVGAACIVSLPLVLWNLKAFIQSTSAAAGAAAFREDAMNFMAMFGYYFPKYLPSATLASQCGVIAAIIGIAIVLRRGPRTPAGFAAGVALVYFLFFAVYKFAFCNYYYLIIAACCCAVGATRAAITIDPPLRSDPPTD